VSAYFDSAVICKWYVPELDTPRALGLRRRLRPPFVLTHLHELEIVTAWHLKAFRGEVPRGAVQQATADLLSDVEAGFWRRPDYDLAAVFDRGRRLSEDHGATLGTRSLDVLHVAAALEVKATVLVSGDKRQLRLARRAGLRVAPF
jgi:predicted nucleic acid-binding protein